MIDHSIKIRAGRATATLLIRFRCRLHSDGDGYLVGINIGGKLYWSDTDTCSSDVIINSVTNIKPTTRDTKSTFSLLYIILIGYFRSRSSWCRSSWLKTLCYGIQALQSPSPRNPVHQKTCKVGQPKFNFNRKRMYYTKCE